MKHIFPISMFVWWFEDDVVLCKIGKAQTQTYNIYVHDDWANNMQVTEMMKNSSKKETLQKAEKFI